MRFAHVHAGRVCGVYDEATHPEGFREHIANTKNHSAVLLEDDQPDPHVGDLFDAQLHAFVPDERHLEEAAAELRSQANVFQVEAEIAAMQLKRLQAFPKHLVHPVELARATEEANRSASSARGLNAAAVATETRRDDARLGAISAVPARRVAPGKR